MLSRHISQQSFLTSLLRELDTEAGEKFCSKSIEVSTCCPFEIVEAATFESICLVGGNKGRYSMTLFVFQKAKTHDQGQKKTRKLSWNLAPFLEDFPLKGDHR